MERLLVATVALQVLAGCQMASRQARPEPLGDEAEVAIYLQPLPSQASRLAFSVESVALQRGDGVESPLAVATQELSGAAAPRQALLASGRVSPGAYASIQIRVRKATLAGDERASDLLVPKEAVRVPVAFTAARGRAAVLQLTLDPSRSVERDFGFTPVFSAVVPPRPLTELLGFVSDTGSDTITVFEKHLRQVVAVLPTGREPRGMAFDTRFSRLYVALSADDQVQQLELPTGSDMGRLRLQPGDRPREIALTPDGRVLVVLNPGTNTVAFCDAASLVELARVPVGQQAVALLVDRSGRFAYAFNRASNAITVLDVANRSVVRTIPTEPEPLRGQLSRDGSRLFVIHAGSPYLLVLSVPDYRVLNRLHVGPGATGLLVDPRTNLVYVAKGFENRIDVYEALSFLATDSFSTPGEGAYLAIDEAYNTLLAVLPRGRGVAAVEVTSRRPLPSMDVGLDPYQVTVAGERN